MTFYCPAHLSALAASSHMVGTGGGYLLFEHPSLGRVAFVRQPIQSVIIQCSVGSLTKRTRPKRRSSSLGRAERPSASGKLVFEHPSLGRVAFVMQPIHSVIIQCSVGSLAKRTLPGRHSLGGRLLVGGDRYLNTHPEVGLPL